MPTPSSVRRGWWEACAPTLRSTGTLALTCNVLLEVIQLSSVDGWFWRFKTPAFPLLFVLGTLVMWLVAGLVHALVGRMAVTRALLVSATVLVALVDHEKVRLRDEPLYPSDLVFAADPGMLAAIVGARGLVLVALGLLLVATVLTLARRRPDRAVAVPLDRARVPTARRLLTRALVAGLCLAGLGYAAQFNHPGNLVRATYDVLGAQWRPWSQHRNYLGNGFVGGVLFNADVPELPRPPGYGPAAVADVVARYSAAAARINREREGTVAGTNVVMVLSESFSDPTRLRGVHVGQDPIPFTRYLMRRTTSGVMLSHSIGGGTANVEFEALTGMSLAMLPPQLRVPYQSLVSNRSRFPSLVRWFDATGHRTVALHPYTREMYRRSDVYQAFGFDEYRSEEDFPHAVRLGRDGYVSDASAFADVRRELRETDDPVFVSLVTMQNHIPYDDRYRDPLPVTGPDGQAMPEAGQYLRGLLHSDDALRRMVAGLERLPEPTALVVYGDHLPGTWPEPVRELNGRFALRQTPYLVWTNMGPRRIEQPFTGPVHFTDLLMEQLDAPVSPYLALLTLLRREVPAMEGRVRYDRTGRVFAADELSLRARRLLHDYRLLQYDLVGGSGYSEATLLRPPAPR